MDFPPALLLEFDPVFILLVVVILGLLLFMFLLLRRTLVGFKRGMQDGKR